MATLLQLAKRRSHDCYYDDNSNFVCPANDNSAWMQWGRWVVLSVVLFVFFAILIGLFCCLSCYARRRGARPMYGTGWMSRGVQPREAYNLEDGYGAKREYEQPQGPPPNTY